MGDLVATEPIRARKVSDLKAQGQVASGIDADMRRLAFVSLAMTPILLNDIFEERMGRPMDAQFLNSLAVFNGLLFSAGLMPSTSK